MSKYGIIWVGHQCEDTLERSLAPWIEARKSRLGGHGFVICAVSEPFEGFQQGEHDNTRLQLYAHHQNGEIDNLIVGDEPTKETKARGDALRWLRAQGATHLWQHDADEFITTDQIAAIARFVEARPVDWYRLSLRNQVFTPNQHLVEPFTPPRIHRVHNPGGFVAAGFHQDNNVYYERPWDGERILDTQMASLTVPKGVAWIAHESWLNNSRSKSKIDYQRARGWPNCSFSWDDSKGGLIWNPSLPIPETETDP